ncbi:MAG: hypothetical protein M0P64_04440 [Candidatus Pacebacteria bacterium]|jgi:hypothetical protein|nr:hypothetical protein [Candidatus Paceibacterota bacterium]
MPNDENPEATIKAEFHSYIEASTFLDVLIDAGFRNHFAAPAEIEQINGPHVVTLHIKKDSYFLVKKTLDEDILFEEWRKNFSLEESLSS